MKLQVLTTYNKQTSFSWFHSAMTKMRVCTIWIIIRVPLYLRVFLLFFSTEKQPFQCYIHAVSPVKKANRSDKKYFNFTVQRKDSRSHGVCIVYQMHSKLTTFQKSKSQVKVENYGMSNSNDIVFNQNTKVFLQDQPEQDFTFANDVAVANSGLAKDIASLSNIASDQIVSLKACVTHVSGVKKITTQFQGTLLKQEVHLADCSVSIKLTFGNPMWKLWT